MPKTKTYKSTTPTISLWLRPLAASFLATNIGLHVNRNRNLQIHKALLKSQAQGTSLFTSL